MSYFCAKKNSAKALLHNQTMFSDISAVTGEGMIGAEQEDISMNIGVSAALPGVFVSMARYRQFFSMFWTFYNAPVDL